MSTSKLRIANPGDHDWTRGLFKMWADQHSPVHVYVWSKSFDSAFEHMVDYFDEQGMCGMFTYVDDDDLRAAAKDLGIGWSEDGWDDLSERDQDRVLTAAEADMTMIGHTTLRGCEHEHKGMPGIISDDWGGGEVDPKSAEYKRVKEASEKLSENGRRKGPRMTASERLVFDKTNAIAHIDRGLREKDWPAVEHGIAELRKTKSPLIGWYQERYDAARGVTSKNPSKRGSKKRGSKRRGSKRRTSRRRR